MNRQEREKLRELCNFVKIARRQKNSDPDIYTAVQNFHDEIDASHVLALLDHIDALEGQLSAKPSGYLVRKAYEKWNVQGTEKTGEMQIKQHIEANEADAIFFRDSLGFEMIPLVAIASAPEVKN